MKQKAVTWNRAITANTDFYMAACALYYSCHKAFHYLRISLEFVLLVLWTFYLAVIKPQTMTSLMTCPEASGYQRVFLFLPRILSYPALVENVLWGIFFSVAPSASVLLGCPIKCYKLCTRVCTHARPHTHISGLHGCLSSMSLTELAAKALVQDWEG